MARFAEALNRSMEDIKRPPPLPVGNYIFQVTKMPDVPTEMAGKDGTSYEKLTILVAAIQALDDVDPDDLAEFGKVNGVPSRLDFIFNNDDDQKFESTLNRVKEFMRRCGIDADQGEFKERLADLPNCRFIGEIGHRPDPNDDTIVYAEIRKTSAV